VKNLSVPESIVSFVKEASEEFSKFLSTTDRLSVFGFPAVFVYTKNIEEGDLAEIVQYVNALKFSREGTAIVRDLKAKLRMKRMGSKEKTIIIGQFLLELRRKMTVLLKTLDKTASVEFNQRESANIQLIISPYYRSLMLIGVFRVAHLSAEKFGYYSMAIESEFDLKKLLGYVQAQIEGHGVISVVKEELEGILNSIIGILKP